jgi:hypothetical protein
VRWEGSGERRYPIFFKENKNNNNKVIIKYYSYIERKTKFIGLNIPPKAEMLKLM